VAQVRSCAAPRPRVVVLLYLQNVSSSGDHVKTLRCVLGTSLASQAVDDSFPSWVVTVEHKKGHLVISAGLSFVKRERKKLLRTRITATMLYTIDIISVVFSGSY